MRTVRCSLPTLLLTFLLTLAAVSCSSEHESNREGEGDGEEDPDLGPADAAGDLADGELDAQPDTGVDEWENQVRLKDGITVKRRAQPNPLISVVYSQPVGSGQTRRLCYWQGSSPEEETARECLSLPVGNPSNPVMAGDGQYVVFYEAGGTKLLMAELSTGTVTTLITVLPADTFALRNPSVSRNAEFVAYQRAFEDATHIVRYDRVRAEDFLLWEVAGSTGAPSISESGNLIVFHSDAGGDNDVWQWTGERPTSPTDITENTRESHEKDARISANGDVICYRKSAQVEGRVGDMVVASDQRQTSVPISRNITSGYGLSYLNNHDCQLSSTGRHVVFRSLPGQFQRTEWLKGGYFYVYDLNADRHRQLPEPAAVDKTKPHSPWRLSSDGRWIVFTAVPVGESNPDVWLLSVDTGHLTRLVKTPEAEGTGAPAIN